MNGSSAMTGVRAIRASVRMFGRVQRTAAVASGQLSVFSTSFEIAFSVSNTPSPRTATASK